MKRPPKLSPDIVEPLFCGSSKVLQNFRHNSHNISPQKKILKIHRRASAGAQGELFTPVKQGSEEIFTRRKPRKMPELWTPKRGKCERFGWLALWGLALGETHLGMTHSWQSILPGDFVKTYLQKISSKILVSLVSLLSHLCIIPPVFPLSLCFLTSWSQYCAHMVMLQANVSKNCHRGQNCYKTTCSNSALTPYGFIEASLLHYYLSSHFWFWGLNCSINPKFGSCLFSFQLWCLPNSETGTQIYLLKLEHLWMNRQAFSVSTKFFHQLKTLSEIISRSNHYSSLQDHHTILQKVFTCNATLAEESYDFKFWIFLDAMKTGMRGHSPRPAFYKPAPLFLSNSKGHVTSS